MIKLYRTPLKKKKKHLKNVKIPWSQIVLYKPFTVDLGYGIFVSMTPDLSFPKQVLGFP